MPLIPIETGMNEDVRGKNIVGHENSEYGYFIAQVLNAEDSLQVDSRVVESKRKMHILHLSMSMVLDYLESIFQ